MLGEPLGSFASVSLRKIRRLEEVAVVAAQPRRYGWLNTPNDILIRGFHSLSSSPGHEVVGVLCGILFYKQYVLNVGNRN